MRSLIPVFLLLAILLAGTPAGAHPADGSPHKLSGVSDMNSVLSCLPGAGGIFTGNTMVTATPSGTNADPLIDELLSGNQRFRDDVYNSSYERYQEIAAGQEPGVLWIGCSDSRSDPERITDAGPGEIFVTRNVGNIVPNHDWSLAAVVEYSVNYLNVREIIICGHSDCGAMKALDANLTDPYIPLWLNDAREAKVRVDSRVGLPEGKAARAREIELENVRLQVEHLMTYPTVRDAVAGGRIQVHGLYYNLSTGVLSQVI